MSTATLEPARSYISASAAPNEGLTVADAVWVGMALLHRARPGQDSFPKDDVVQSVVEHALTKAELRSIKQHVNQHCVANCKPQPNRSRMLYATRENHRVLFVPGFHRYDPGREGSPTHPDWNDLPPQYAYLRTWYEQEFRLNHKTTPMDDPLLALIGAGAEIWKDEPADEYVANLRKGWEGRS